MLICHADIDGDGILNHYDNDIDGDNINNSDDSDIDGNGEKDPEGFLLEECKIDKWPLMFYYPYFLILIAPFYLLFYRKKVSVLIYKCFSICLTLTIGIILGQLFMMFILTSFSFDTNHF